MSTDTPDPDPPTLIGADNSAARVPALTILWHPDIQRVGQCAILQGWRVAVSRREPLFRVRTSRKNDGRPLADQYPKLVTDDFERTFRVEFDTATATPSTRSGPCNFAVTTNVSLQLAQDGDRLRIQPECVLSMRIGPEGNTDVRRYRTEIIETASVQRALDDLGDVPRRCIGDKAAAATGAGGRR